MKNLLLYKEKTGRISSDKWRCLCWTLLGHISAFPVKDKQLNPNHYLLVFYEGKPAGIHQTRSLLLLVSWFSHSILSSGSASVGVWLNVLPHPWSLSNVPPLCSTSVFLCHLPLNPSSVCLPRCRDSEPPVIKLQVLPEEPDAPTCLSYPLTPEHG